MDDLAGSIIDGRYVAQKFRFGRAGIRQPIYVVEDYRNTSLNMDFSALVGIALLRPIVVFIQNIGLSTDC